MFGMSVFDVAEVINVILEIALVFFFYHHLYEKKYSSNIFYLLGYLVAFVVLLVVSILITSPYVRIGFTFVLLLIIAELLYKSTLVIKLFASFYFILIVFVSETLFAGILALMEYGNVNDLLASERGIILGMIGTKIIDFWLVVYTCRIYKKEFKSLPVRYWLLIILMPFLSIIILNQIFLVNQSGIDEMMGYIISVSGIMYLNFSVFDYLESYDKKIRLIALEQIMERESVNYKTLEKSYMEIRSIKHDLSNQVSVLNNLIENSQYEKAQKYIKNLNEIVSTVTNVCYTGNVAVDSIINLKGDYARSHKIKFLCKIRISSINVDDIAICRILGNALDNAIEACERTHKEEKSICITFYQHEDKLILEIDNTSLPVDVKNLISTKANKEFHGIGIHSIQNTVASLKGYISYNYENGYFSMKIVLPNY